MSFYTRYDDDATGRRRVSSSRAACIELPDNSDLRPNPRPYAAGSGVWRARPGEVGGPPPPPPGRRRDRSDHRSSERRNLRRLSASLQPTSLARTPPPKTRRRRSRRRRRRRRRVDDGIGRSVALKFKMSRHFRHRPTIVACWSHSSSSCAQRGGRFGVRQRRAVHRRQLTSLLVFITV